MKIKLVPYMEVDNFKNLICFFFLPLGFPPAPETMFPEVMLAL